MFTRVRPDCMQAVNGMNKILHLRAPAKINFVLRVLSRRADGYHELETWMQKLDLYDELSLQLRKGGGIELHCDDNEIPLGAENIACQAAAAFFDATLCGKEFGLVIHLKKKIPAAAGLGGGSSDAGTVLKGLNALFGNRFSLEEMVKMARSLGADVPFFVTDYDAVLATGIGEKMVPVPSVRDAEFLLVNAGFAVSTQWVFEKYALTRANKNSRLTGSHKLNPDLLVLSDMINDLEQITVNRYPEIGKVKEQLTAAGAEKVLMSGSGPTVFGVFPDTQKNQQSRIAGAAEKMRLEYGTKVFVVRASNGV